MNSNTGLNRPFGTIWSPILFWVIFVIVSLNFLFAAVFLFWHEEYSAAMIPVVCMISIFFVMNLMRQYRGSISIYFAKSVMFATALLLVPIFYLGTAGLISPELFHTSDLVRSSFAGNLIQRVTTIELILVFFGWLNFRLAKAKSSDRASENRV